MVYYGLQTIFNQIILGIFNPHITASFKKSPTIHPASNSQTLQEFYTGKQFQLLFSFACKTEGCRVQLDFRISWAWYRFSFITGIHHGHTSPPTHFRLQLQRFWFCLHSTCLYISPNSGTGSLCFDRHLFLYPPLSTAVVPSPNSWWRTETIHAHWQRTENYLSWKQYSWHFLWHITMPMESMLFW